MEHSVRRFSNRLLKRDIFQYTAHRQKADMIRRALGIRAQCFIHGDVHNCAIWRKVFRVQEFQTDMRAFPQLILVYSVSPTVWIPRSNSASDIHQVVAARGVGYCHRLGFFSLQFALRVWSVFMDTPSLEGVRREILHEWGPYLRAPLSMESQHVPRKYEWVVGAAPTTRAIKKVLQKTRALFDRRRREVTESLAIAEGRVLRTGGHFKLRRKIIPRNGFPSRAIIAAIGFGGFLLQEVTIVRSESATAYVDCVRPILLARRSNILTPPHAISDNPGILSSAMAASLNDIWGGAARSKFLLSGDPAHRKIEFQESMDKTHHDTWAVIRDFA